MAKKKSKRPVPQYMKELKYVAKFGTTQKKRKRKK